MSSECFAPTLQPVEQSPHSTQPCCRIPWAFVRSEKAMASGAAYASASQTPFCLRAAAVPRWILSLGEKRSSGVRCGASMRRARR